MKKTKASDIERDTLMAAYAGAVARGEDNLYQNTHPFKGEGEQCKHIVSDYVGECGCGRENEVHSK